MRPVFARLQYCVSIKAIQEIKLMATRCVTMRKQVSLTIKKSATL